jgi:hypothetical protein
VLKTALENAQPLPTAPATWVTRWAFAALTPTTPIPRSAAVAAPELACVSPGAAVVVRALLVEELARPVAGSGSCCFRGPSYR